MERVCNHDIIVVTGGLYHKYVFYMLICQKSMIFTNIYIYINIYVYANIYIHIYIYVYKYIYIYLYTYSYIYTCVLFIYSCIYLLMYFFFVSLSIYLLIYLFYSIYLLMYVCVRVRVIYPDLLFQWLLPVVTCYCHGCTHFIETPSHSSTRCLGHGPTTWRPWTTPPRQKDSILGRIK